MRTGAAMFDSLTRGNMYTFAFTGGHDAIRATFHEIAPDGLLVVAGTSAAHRTRSAQTHRLNPEQVVWVREETP